MTVMKKIFAYILGTVAVLSISACSDQFLEKAPKLSLSNELALSTYDGCNNAVAGAYSYISSTGWWGCDRVTENEMRCGNGVKSAAVNSNRCTQGYNWNYTEDNTNTTMWAYCYYVSAAVNNVIDAIDATGASEQDINNLKAECLFLRAFAHFENVLQFGQPYTYKKDSPGVPSKSHCRPSGKAARPCPPDSPYCR